MRVIAGTAKGTRLGPVPPGVRPVSDRAREGLFSSLAADVPGAVVLDLFAGTGSLGIEALSRGAERAVFVERDRRAIRAVGDNLARARLADRGEVAGLDVARYLGGPPPAEPFDLVLADPPYEADAAEVGTLLAAPAGTWLAEGATVALTRGTRSSTPVIPLHWLVSRRLEYGDSAVLIFREA
jgi:16S rRNA (guanine966-N2)-methyltransferase